MFDSLNFLWIFDDLNFGAGFDCGGTRTVLPFRDFKVGFFILLFYLSQCFSVTLRYDLS